MALWLAAWNYMHNLALQHNNSLKAKSINNAFSTCFEGEEVQAAPYIYPTGREAIAQHYHP
jgi:hypothetical protein